MIFFIKYVLPKTKQFKNILFIDVVLSLMLLSIYFINANENIYTKIINCLLIISFSILVCLFFLLFLLKFYKDKKRVIYEIISMFYLIGSLIIMGSAIVLINRDKILYSIGTIPFLQILIIGIYNRFFVWKLDQRNILNEYNVDKENKNNNKIVI